MHGSLEIVDERRGLLVLEFSGGERGHGDFVLNWDMLKKGIKLKSQKTPY